MFLQGSLVDVEWKTRPDDKKLASILVDNAKITKEQAQKAIIKQRDTGQKLGFILINMGILTEDDLKGPLTIHMMEGLRTALQVENGRFTFTDSSPNEYRSIAALTRSMHTTCTTRCCSVTKRCRLFKTASIPRYCPPKQRICFCCPAVKYPPTRPNYWGRDEWHFLMSFLTKKYDMVIVDSPPLLPTTDALILSSHVDGVLFVCRSGLMNRKMVIRSLKQLETAKANVLGIVLNRVNVEKEGYYKYYHKYYTQYYDK